MTDIGITRHVAATVAGQTTFANNLLGTAESITAPSGHIRALGVSVSKSITDVAGAGVTVAIRLTGTSLSGGVQDYTMGTLTSDTTSTGGAKVQEPYYLDVDISIAQGATITASVITNGVDPGTLEVDLTLVFN